MLPTQHRADQRHQKSVYTDTAHTIRTQAKTRSAPQLFQLLASGHGGTNPLPEVFYAQGNDFV